MKPLTLLALLLLSCGSVGAADSPTNKIPWKLSSGEIVYIPADDPHAKIWQVIRGTESFTLSDFVNSGKFCEWRGKHEWKDAEHEDKCYQDYDWKLSSGEIRKLKSIGYKCFICHRCRRRIKVNKVEEVWEP